MKKGDKVYVFTRVHGLIEGLVVSSGPKYTKIYYKGRDHEFDSETGESTFGFGRPDYIVKDIDKFNESRSKRDVISEIKQYDFYELTMNQLQRIKNIMDESEEDNNDISERYCE